MVALADHVRGWVGTVNDKGVKAAVEEAAEDAKAKAEKIKEVAKSN